MGTHRENEDEAAKHAHKKMTPQELQDAYEHAREQVTKGSEYFQREEERIRKEMANRGMAPKTDPRG